MALKRKTRSKLSLFFLGGLVLLLVILATIVVAVQTGDNDLRSRAAPAGGLTGGDDLLSIEQDLQTVTPNDSTLESLEELQ